MFELITVIEHKIQPFLMFYLKARHIKQFSLVQNDLTIKLLQFSNNMAEILKEVVLFWDQKMN